MARFGYEGDCRENEANVSNLNGHTLLTPRTDLHAAAELLWGELVGYPWFVGLERDELGGKLVVEVKDLNAAASWCGGRDWFGWRIDIRKGKATVG